MFTFLHYTIDDKSKDTIFYIKLRIIQVPGVISSVCSIMQGKVITCRAAVCWQKGDDLKIEEIEIQPPSKNEVRVKIITTSLVSEILLTAREYKVRIRLH